ncbi:HAMP domain-containing histidine kinase [Gordonia sp. TBRC 11910]|uniref:histidine kinase n=1 Tax=Gordonia asplenii TaxID=2725283 RepID=A0A848KTI5_9ACTN|nr:HAMP domain-containing sensor histidine kinase [Gordonia asplenii]NMO00195.1 HAMP domain-containing histidine kinase [Gordonia asplenii]
MLAADALLTIVLTSVACTGAVTAATMLTLWLARRRSLAARSAIVLAGALAAVIASTLAIAAEMYLSGHDLVVLCWVIGTSAALSMIATWVVTGRTVTASVTELIGATRRVGDGDVVDANRSWWPEFDAVSAELATTSQRLAEARAQVNELDAARRQFFAWISHDLRTPLAGMRAMAEALDEGTAPDPAAYIRTIRTKVDTLGTMVADLFELSKLETGTLRIAPEVVVLLDLVSDAVADVATQAAARGIRIERDGIDEHLIWVDPRELTRAIGNLLSNSLAHAPDDTVVLIRADVLSERELILSVIDQGPGVTSENLGRMFDVGWRADAARSGDDDSAPTGAGLGLAIVRGIVEAHGGAVGARHTDAGFQLELILPTGPPPAN